MAPTDTSRLAALGRTVTFVDGSTAQLRYSMRALILLESRFGSMAGLQDALGDIEQMDRPMLAPLLDIIGAGLCDAGFVPHVRERVVTVRTTTPDGRTVARDEREVTSVTYVRQSDRVELGTLLDPASVEALSELMGAALAEAMPAGEAPAPTLGAAPVMPESFRGPTSTTSPLSPSVAMTLASGL